MKKIVVCADDYGLYPQIDQAILDLIALKRISATSCLMNFAGIQRAAKQLVPFFSQIDVGLHFNLTEGRPLSASPLLTADNGEFYCLAPLLGLSLTRKIDKQAVMAECHAQVDMFESVYHVLPDFIDGHQHVHHLPVIRDAVLAVYQQRLRQHKTYCRSVRTTWPLSVKMIVLQVTGAVIFDRLLKQHTIPHNRSFSGLYGFNPQTNYSQLWRGFFKQIQTKGLIMCHPGLLYSEDCIGEVRLAEYTYLKSDVFTADCVAENIHMTRFSAI